MKESFCEILLDYNSRVYDADDLFSTYIANCNFNSFLSYSAIMLNIVTIHAIRKTPSLPKTLKTLLLSLAVSDVGVGLLVQPFYTSILTKWLQQSNPGCNTSKVFHITKNLFSLASFFGVVALSVDRFLAIHLHLRYQELVTHKRVVAVVILIWVISAFLPLSAIFSVPLDIYPHIKVIVDAACIILVTMVYIRIYLAVRRHKNQIQVLQVQQVAHGDQLANLSSLIKSTVGIFYIYFVFLLCYLPYLITSVATTMNGLSIVLKGCSVFSLTLVFLNSSLNPVIYCWKMKHIRRAVIKIMKNVPRQRSQESQEILPIAAHSMP